MRCKKFEKSRAGLDQKEKWVDKITTGKVKYEYVTTEWNEHRIHEKSLIM